MPITSFTTLQHSPAIPTNPIRPLQYSKQEYFHYKPHIVTYYYKALVPVGTLLLLAY